MARRTMGTSASLLALIMALAACSSSGHKASSTTSTHASTSTAPASASTSTAAPSTTTTPGTTAPPTTAPTPPPDARTAGTRFFAAWLAHDAAGLATNGTATAVDEATAQYAKTTGTAWQFSNCQGAAGSIYCTWVRAAEDVVVRASDVNPANRVVEFRWNALQAPGIASQFVDAWQFGSTNALLGLGTPDAVTQVQALATHTSDGWQAPSSCDGTAGSFYCTFTAGAHDLIVRVGDVEVPHQVIGVTYR